MHLPLPPFGFGRLWSLLRLPKPIGWLDRVLPDRLGWCPDDPVARRHRKRPRPCPSAGGA